MPQKRNPDSLELIRGMSASIFSKLTGIMMTLKATPSTYNKDFQFDKQYMFESFDQLEQCLQVMQGVLHTIQIKRHNMESALSPDMLATDWAYYLVRKGVPFRQAHHYIGKVVAYAEHAGLELTSIPLEDLQNICPQFDVDIALVADYGVNVEQYNVPGGTATKSIKSQLKVLKEFLAHIRKSE